MKNFILRHWNNKELPMGVRIITIITSIRWIGWGFAENLIPVLIYTFGHSLARSGLINSVYSIALILVVPIVGFAADRMRATSLIAIGLVIYLFVGASYFLVGITGMVIFIIIARFLNGISYSFDSVGRETYIMRYTPPSIAATAFGYFDTIANFWWIAAALVGIALLPFFSISTLLFFITPTSFIALLIVLRFRKKEPRVTTNNRKGVGRLSLIEIRSWSKVLKSLTIFNFFITAIGAVVAFFVPIEAYKSGASLSAIVIMGVIATVPTLFGWDFGKLFDIKGSKMFTVGLISFSILLLLLVFLRSYAWQVFIYFMVNMVLELLSVGSLELMTTHTKPEHFGKVDGFIKSTEYIGAVVGPLAAGIIMDGYGFAAAYTVFAAIVMFLAIMFYILQHKGYIEKPIIIEESLFKKQ